MYRKVFPNLTSLGHTVEAVDVDDRDGITNLIESVLDVGQSSGT